MHFDLVKGQNVTFGDEVFGSSAALKLDYELDCLFRLIKMASSTKFGFSSIR
jgi:hypothetical protein